MNDSGFNGSHQGEAAKQRRGSPPLSLLPEEVIAKRRDRLEQKSSLLAFGIKLVFVILALWLIFSFLFGVAVMHGESMYPRLRDGDLFLYYRLETEYHIGDVVTFTTAEGKRYTGRITAQGGDSVDMSATGALLVNGNAQDEEVFYPTYKTEAATELPCMLQEGQVFLLCDLRTAGTDSRVYGAVEVSNLEGKIITILRRRGI